ncbi:hypothetical protein [Shewanella sp.]|uniref:hypothetical protein n=1 Tax=Shewanella sp. TaxID=50422 RepID=UPI003A9808DD
MKEYLPYITAVVSVAAFCFTAFKYMHSQRIAQANKRFEQFIKIFEWVAGRTAEGNPLVDTQQAMAIYQLGEFPEYRHMSLPIIQYYIEQSSGDPDDSLFRAALLKTKARLSDYA